jgi:C1A family cysteine protease
LSDVIEKLKENKPVIVAAKLTENFYVNKGLVTLEDSQNTGKKQDSHSLGHAFLAVGVIELPVKLKSTEGDYCLLVANSWGKGWGAGGYACITQKWMEKYRQPSAFIALSSAKI